jgi:hypothetical protein
MNASECKYISRIYYPLGNMTCRATGRQAPAQEEIQYNLVDRHTGSVVRQAGRLHTCKKPISWRHHILSSSKKGLHPTLKEAVNREGEMDPYHLPKPSGMLSRIKEQFSHDINVLFPSECLGIVENQISAYWGDRRQQIILSRDRRKVDVSYLPNIVKFQEEHVKWSCRKRCCISKG